MTWSTRTAERPRLLKPDRTIVAPGDPGWDDAIPDRPKSRWWRTLLAGRAGLTRLQPGACCGCGGTCSWPSCGGQSMAWSQSSPITLAWTAGSGASGSTSLAYNASGSLGAGWYGVQPFCASSTCSPPDLFVPCSGNAGFALEVVGACGLTCAQASSVTSSPPTIVWTNPTTICTNTRPFTPINYCTFICGASLDPFTSLTISQ